MGTRTSQWQWRAPKMFTVYMRVFTVMFTVLYNCVGYQLRKACISCVYHCNCSEVRKWKFTSVFFVCFRYWNGHKRQLWVRGRLGLSGCDSTSNTRMRSIHSRTTSHAKNLDLLHSFQPKAPRMIYYLHQKHWKSAECPALLSGMMPSVALWKCEITTESFSTA